MFQLWTTRLQKCHPLWTSDVMDLVECWIMELMWCPSHGHTYHKALKPPWCPPPVYSQESRSWIWIHTIMFQATLRAKGKFDQYSWLLACIWTGCWTGYTHLHGNINHFVSVIKLKHLISIYAEPYMVALSLRLYSTIISFGISTNLRRTYSYLNKSVFK